MFRPIAKDELRQLAVRGAGVSVLSKSSNLFIRIGSTVVLARLLTPADFGIVAMVTTFSLVLMSFGLNGFTEAIIQWDEITHVTASNLFWMTMAAGALLTVAFGMTGTLLADFFHNPLVANVTVALSSTIFIASASYPHLALLKRAMCFPALSANEVCANVVGVTVAVLLALAGWGYWALVAGFIAQPMSSAIGAWWLCRWVPGIPRRTEATGPMLRFAIYVYVRYGFRHFCRNLDKLLVGWRFNAAALGFYKKAYDLFALSADHLISPLGDVALATLSRLRNDPAQFRRCLVNALAVIAFVGMGLGADLALAGMDIIRLVLGPGWDEAGRIFVFFGPGIGVMLLHSCSGWIHLSIGRPDRWLRWTVAEFCFTALLFSLALHWGPTGIAASWSACFWILTIPAFWYAGRPIRIGVSPLLNAVWKYVVASLLAGLASVGVLREFMSFHAATAGGALGGIVVISAVFAVLYLGAVIALHGGCAPLYRVARLLREMPWPGKPASLDSILATDTQECPVAAGSGRC